MSHTSPVLYPYAQPPAVADSPGSLAAVTEEDGVISTANTETMSGLRGDPERGLPIDNAVSPDVFGLPTEARFFQRAQNFLRDRPAGIQLTRVFNQFSYPTLVFGGVTLFDTVHREVGLGVLDQGLVIGGTLLLCSLLERLFPNVPTDNAMAPTDWRLHFFSIAVTSSLMPEFVMGGLYEGFSEFLRRSVFSADPMPWEWIGTRAGGIFTALTGVAPAMLLESPLGPFIKAYLVCAGTELVIYPLHRFEHLNMVGWSLHSIHHWTDKLTAAHSTYGHIIEETVKASLAISVLAGLGVPPDWTLLGLVMIAVNGIPQHSNMDNSPGRFFSQWILCDSANHRGHHNLYEFDINHCSTIPWMDNIPWGHIWDHAILLMVAATAAMGITPGLSAADIKKFQDWIPQKGPTFKYLPGPIPVGIDPREKASIGDAYFAGHSVYPLRVLAELLEERLQTMPDLRDKLLALWPGIFSHQPRVLPVLRQLEAERV